MNYTIQQLNYLVAIDTHGSFSKAAEHCFVTQPTLSMQVRKMEEEIGMEIIDRSKHPIRFTEVGERLVAQAREALQELRRIDDIISDSRGDVKGELTVGIIPTLAPYLVPLFIGSFLKQYPDIALHITEYKTEEIVDRLQKETLDLGLLATPLYEASLYEEPLFYEKMLCYMDPAFAAKTGNRVEIAQILEEKLWVLGEGNCFRNQTFNLCSIGQTRFRDQQFHYESGSIETLMRLVEKEGGSTIIPELAIGTLTDDRLDKVKFIGQANPVREISTVVRRKQLKKKLIEVFRNEVLKHLPPGVLENDASRRVEIF